MSGLLDTIVAALRYEVAPAPTKIIGPTTVQDLVCAGDFRAAAGIIGGLVMEYLAPVILSGEVHPDGERCSDPDLCYLFVEAGARAKEAEAAQEAPAPEGVRVDTLKPARAEANPRWTWADEARSIDARECLCCGLAGHYQRQLDRAVAAGAVAVSDLAVYVRDGGFVGDGHHRVVAALRAGIEVLPVETQEAAQQRWIRDHGLVSWHDRKVGDR